MLDMAEHARDYIRHPLNVPIRLTAGSQGEPDGLGEGQSRNVSKGGICCIADRRFMRGETLMLKIDAVKPAFETRAKVIWCQELEAGVYEVGCSFMSREDAFAARMVEQICHIEEYRDRILQDEGRILSQEEAAEEWITRFAGTFPGSSGEAH
ncbi:MAG: PilZ domain-containing protein [Hahellaceae bacterium]|nr:PilZ domain-containing protein [Hahellaceae bacterium]